MKTILLQITDELAAAMDAARGDTPRNPAIEQWLWSIKPIRDAAKSQKIRKPNRRKPGRPKC